jgi:hypothetical protein
MKARLSSSVVRNGLATAGAILLASAIAPPPAHAYIDPVSGSIILQVIAAGALAAAFTFKRFTLKVRETIRSLWIRIRST